MSVLSVDGQPINGLQAVLRNILRTVDAQPGLTYLLGLVAASSNARFQRLGDYVCGTMVVVEERSWFHGVIRSADAEVKELAEQIPAGFDVSPTLARALAAYVQRRAMFSPARRMEIARHVGEPLRARFGMPLGTNPDCLLSALYRRTFITDGNNQDELPRRPAGASHGSPFRRPEEGPSAGGTVPPIVLHDDATSDAEHVDVADGGASRPSQGDDERTPPSDRRAPPMEDPQ